jgi:hypothetical protein
MSTNNSLPIKSILSTPKNLNTPKIQKQVVINENVNKIQIIPNYYSQQSSLSYENCEKISLYLSRTSNSVETIQALKNLLELKQFAYYVNYIYIRSSSQDHLHQKHIENGLKLNSSRKYLPCFSYIFSSWSCNNGNLSEE